MQAELSFLRKMAGMMMVVRAINRRKEEAQFKADEDWAIKVSHQYDDNEELKLMKDFLKFGHSFEIEHPSPHLQSLFDFISSQQSLELPPPTTRIPDSLLLLTTCFTFNLH